MPGTRPMSKTMASESTTLNPFIQRPIAVVLYLSVYFYNGIVSPHTWTLSSSIISCNNCVMMLQVLFKARSIYSTVLSRHDPKLWVRRAILIRTLMNMQLIWDSCILQAPQPNLAPLGSGMPSQTAETTFDTSRQNAWDETQRNLRPSPGASALPSIMALSSIEAYRQKSARDAALATQVFLRPSVVQPIHCIAGPRIHYRLWSSNMHLSQA